MKIPTYKSVFKKAIQEEKLDPIENFIAKHGLAGGDEKGQRQFMRDLQKLVDYVEDERTKHIDEAEHGA